VAQIEVRFRAVIQNVDLAVLVRRHRARVDVDIRVQLLHRDLEAAFLEEQPHRRGGYTLANRRNNTAGKK